MTTKREIVEAEAAFLTFSFKLVLEELFPELEEKQLKDLIVAGCLAAGKPFKTEKEYFFDLIRQYSENTKEADKTIKLMEEYFIFILSMSCYCGIDIMEPYSTGYRCFSIWNDELEAKEKNRKKNTKKLLKLGFKQNEDGLIIGYYVENKETLSNNWSPLSIENLPDKRPFFIYKNKEELIQKYSNLKENKIYKITFDPYSEIKIYNDFFEYRKLITFNEKKKQWVFTRAAYGSAFMCSLIILDENAQKVSTESFFTSPKTYIKTIEIFVDV